MLHVKDASQLKTIYRCLSMLASYLIWNDLSAYLYVREINMIYYKSYTISDSVSDSFLITTLSKVDSCNQNKQGAV